MDELKKRLSKAAIFASRHFDFLFTQGTGLFVLKVQTRKCFSVGFVSPIVLIRKRRLLKHIHIVFVYVEG